MEPEGLLAHYELIYQVDHARARRLTLRLPAGTPEAWSIRGLDVAVKEFRAEQVEQRPPVDCRIGGTAFRQRALAVDFQQSLPKPRPAAGPPPTPTRQRSGILPLVRADGVVYQSGMVAVEGNMEFDVQVKTDARKVDVGELVDAEYQVGKRLLGAFGFVGEPRRGAWRTYRGGPSSVCRRRSSSERNW